MEQTLELITQSVQQLQTVLDILSENIEYAKHDPEYYKKAKSNLDLLIQDAKELKQDLNRLKNNSTN